MILCYKFSFACLALTHHVIDSQQGHGHLDSGPVFRSLEDGVGVGGKQLGPEGGLQGAGVGGWGPGALGGDEEGEAEYCNGVEKTLNYNYFSCGNKRTLSFPIVFREGLGSWFICISS